MSDNNKSAEENSLLCAAHTQSEHTGSKQTRLDRETNQAVMVTVSLEISTCLDRHIISFSPPVGGDVGELKNCEKKAPGLITRTWC